MPSRRELLQRGTPLARALPGAQFTEGHARVVNARLERVWEALHALRWADLRLTRPLMSVRMLAAGSGGPGRGVDPDRRLVDPPSPAAPLYEDPPRVSASGMIGRPWHLRPVLGPEPAGLDELREFDEGGWLKYGMEWVLSPVAGDRTLVETVTLCEATDGYAWWRFAPYWALIRGFSGLIRRDVLAALARAVS
jgi:hypothetical protein